MTDQRDDRTAALETVLRQKEKNQQAADAEAQGDAAADRDPARQSGQSVSQGERSVALQPIALQKQRIREGQPQSDISATRNQGQGMAGSLRNGANDMANTGSTALSELELILGGYKGPQLPAYTALDYSGSA